MAKLGGFKFGFGLPHQNMKRAVNAQDAFIRQAADARKAGFDESLKAVDETYAPYKDFGSNSMARLLSIINDPSSVRNLPGYGEGIGAIENSAAARGGLLSGNTMRELNDYGQNNFMNWLATYGGLANQGYGMDRDKLGIKTDLLTSRGASEGQRYADLSNYLKMHENAGMNIAAQWASPSTYMGMFGGGGMGGMGGGGGGGGQRQPQQQTNWSVGQVPNYTGWGGGQMSSMNNRWGWK